jgi:GT2 family glycosyltransferase
MKSRLPNQNTSFRDESPQGALLRAPESAPSCPVDDVSVGVSVIVPTYGGRELLGPCLDALDMQDRVADEVIVVDDGSPDDTATWVVRSYPRVKVVALPKNRGFAGAANAGVQASRGRIVVLLNNDTVAEPGWLGALVAPLESDPTVGACASKILVHDDPGMLHAAGDGYTTGGIPTNRGAFTRDDGRFDEGASREWIFGPCAAAAAYRRELLDDTGGFDEWLVSYLEDVDLAWRANLLGYRCRYVPEARIRHRISATAGQVRSSYWCGRNFLLVLARDVPGPILARNWRTILKAQAAIALDALRHWRGEAARARLRGIVAGFVRLPDALRRRGAVQATRRVPIADLERLLTST